MVAAFGNLEIAVVPRCQLQPGIGDEIEIGALHRRCRIAHGGDDLVILLRPGDGEHIGKARPDAVSLMPHAARHDDLAIFGHGLADGFQAFGLGAVEKAAGVDDHHIGAGIIA